jgi:hypothetical protein
VINGSLAQLFELVAHPDHLSQVNPDIHVLSYAPSAIGGYDTEWEYQFGAMKLAGKSNVAIYEPPHKLVVDTQGGIPSHWVWSFTPQPKGAMGVLVAVELDYDIPKPLAFVGSILTKRNEKSVEMQLNNLRALAEATQRMENG